MVTKTFTASFGSTLEAYVVVSHRVDNGVWTVNVTDLVTTSARSAQAILRLLSEYRSIATRVKWKGGPSDLFTNLLPERHLEMALTDSFMVRVVDVPRAFTMRGYPRSASAAITFDLTDASLPENNGSHTVSVENGLAQVSKSGKSQGMRVAISERGLAALYTGHTPPHVLAQSGLLEGNEETLTHLETWFTGSLPTASDFF